MFLALRDLVYAKGRFALVAAVIAMITGLVVMLTGLSAGLSRQSIGAITNLPKQGVNYIGFARAGSQVGFDSSVITAQQAASVAKMDGVRADILHIAPMTVANDGTNTPAVAFVLPDRSPMLPDGVRADGVVTGGGLGKAKTLTIGSNRLTVTGSTAASYQHMPVVWMNETAARAAGVMNAQTPSVMVMKTQLSAAQIAKTSGLVVETPGAAVNRIASYKSENGSLTLMRVTLMGVCALVIGAFFMIWTIQRSGDLAVLKAMGAATSYLARDALGQALVLLVIGAGIGTAAAAGLGVIASHSVPFVVSPSTTLVPLGLLVALGMIGAAFSLRRVVSVDPVHALGALR